MNHDADARRMSDNARRVNHDADARRVNNPAFRVVSELGNGALDLLFPPKCPFCRKILRRPGICDDCAADLPWVDERDAFRVIHGLYCAAPLHYAGAVRKAIRRFKFGGHTAAARAFAETLAACAAERYPGMFDAVTWVPISRERFRQRGYNQAELLAREMCRVWGILPEEALVKPVDNPPQARIRDNAQRWLNVAGVYRPAPGRSCAGKRVLLIDDICTSGATFCECAKCLRDGGAAEVYALSLAMAKS